MSRHAGELAMRNSALAALMGVLDTDFGVEQSCADLGYDYTGVSQQEDAIAIYDGADFGTEVGGLFEQGYGLDMSGMTPAEFGAVDAAGASSMLAPAALANAAAIQPSPAAVAVQHAATPEGRAIIAQHVAKTNVRNRRLSLINPNGGSDVKVGRYKFAVNATITALGTAGALTGSNSPDVHFRSERVTMNVVSPGMVTITDGRIANVSFIVGGSVDAWDFNANAVDQLLGMEPMTPANKATFVGNYTGLVPSPLSGTGAYGFVMSLAGPATAIG